MKKLGLFILFAVALFPCELMAAPPDAGSIMREIGDRPTVLPEKPLERPLTPEPPPPKVQQGPRVLVKAFRIIGATLFTESELQAVVAGYVGRELDFSELNEAVQAISAYYRSKGFIAQTLLPPQEIKGGVITIQVVEGKLGAVEVVPGPGVRFSRDRVAKTITSRQRVGEPIRIEEVEGGLMLLNDNPGISVSATMQPGADPGTTNLVVAVSKTPLLTGSVDFDNNGSVSSGEYRLTAGLNVNNPGGFGDQFSLKGLSSIDSNYGRLAYSLPLGTGGTRLGASYSYLSYKLGGDLKSLDAKGNALTTGLNVNIPLIRKRSGNVYSTVGYEYREYTNSVLGRDVSDKNVRVGTFGLFWDLYDRILGGGYTTLSISATMGSLDLSGNRSDQATDHVGPRAEGHYNKFNFGFSRIQRIYGDGTSLQINFNGQLSNNNLDSSEKISLGGPSAVRALPPNEGSGDEGFIFTAEVHQKITENTQIFGFYDFGHIRQHHTIYQGWYSAKGAANVYDMDGVGLGFSWTKPGFVSIKGTVAQRVRTNPGKNANGKDSDGTLREPRFWIQTSYYF
jgi:hemolysin activation/secretion protein